MRALRVATYNTHDLTGDRAAAARVVRRLDPDILCLQEVPRRLLSTRRVIAFAADCDLVSSGSHRGGGGTTVFTSPRVRVEVPRHHRLPVPPFQRSRGYAVAHVGVPGRAPLAVASVHLGLDADQRESHARQILGGLLGGAPGPVVVAGDLNEAEDGAAWRCLAGSLRELSPPGATFPAGRPRHRIDVVFGSSSLRVLPAVAVPLDEADLSAASDHRPVWADLDPDMLPPA